MSGRVLGVIGGLGPMATAHFLDLIAHMTQAPTEQEHVDMIVYNFPSIPDRTCYILGSNLKSPLPGLLWAGRALAREGTDMIAIPSVTAHYFYEELSEELRVPVIHGIRETARYLRGCGITSAGIMATDGTIISGIFSQALMEEGIRPVLPGRQAQADVMHLIYSNIKAGKPAEMDRFHAVERELREKGAQAVILGCTELSIIAKEHTLGPGFLDTAQVLARAAILGCGASLREEYNQLITQ